MSHLRSPVVFLAISLFTSGACVIGELQIGLFYNGQTNDSLRAYADNSLFSGRYANIPSVGFVGRILQPEPRNACQYIPLLPTSLTENSSWIALVDGYPSCPIEMVNNVRNARYRLIITSSYYDTDLVVSSVLSNTQFPVAAIREEYANYLRENAQSHSSDDPITVHVYVSSNPLSEPPILSTSIIIKISIILGFITFVCGCCGCALLRNSQCFRNENQEEQHQFLEHRQCQERFARQEVIWTKRLLRRKYHAAAGEVCDTCVICVSDFQEGVDVCVLPCDHVFHPRCVDEWLGHHSSLCPLCKMEVKRRRPESSRGSPPPFVSSSDDETPFSPTLGSEVQLLIDQSRSNNSDSVQAHYGSV